MKVCFFNNTVLAFYKGKFDVGVLKKISTNIRLVPRL